MQEASAISAHLPAKWRQAKGRRFRGGARSGLPYSGIKGVAMK